MAEADAQEVEVGAVDPESLKEAQQIEDPLVVPVRVVYAARDEQAVEAVELLHGGDTAALFRDDEDLVGLNAERRLVGPAGFGKVLMDYLAEGAALRVCVWVRLVGLEDHEADDGRRFRGFVGAVHAVCVPVGMVCAGVGKLATFAMCVESGLKKCDIRRRRIDVTAVAPKCQLTWLSLYQSLGRKDSMRN